MKIKKLIISAFGPYPGKEEIDFENQLNGKSMFVITGTTGSGKTTIFDAINFALYGEASGSDREGKTLRSDFADEDTPTEVELYFTIRNKDYYIKRSPQYSRKKKKKDANGDYGYTEVKPTAELKIKDKTYTGSKEVTRYVEEILGINSEQFKQLVMIPQGEFKKLLNADSDKREEIFRRIFGTKVFSDISQKIKNEANELKKRIEGVQRDRYNAINSFVVDGENNILKDLIKGKDININLVSKLFKEEVENSKSKENIIKESINKLKEEIENINKEVTLLNENNRKLLNKEKNKSELDRLLALKEKQEEYKIDLEKAKKAVKVLVYEEGYEEKNKSLKSNDLSIKKSMENIKLIEKEMKNLKIILEKESNKEEEKDIIIKRVNEISNLKERARSYDLVKIEVEKYLKEVKIIRNNLKVKETEIQENSMKILKLNEDIDKINKFKEDNKELEVNILKNNNLIDDFKSLIEGILSYIKNKNLKEQIEIEYNNSNNKYIENKNKYEELEEVLRKNQAGILARDLKGGTPCPVCGSLEHPNLAVLENQVISEDSVKKSKVEMEIVKEERDKIYEKVLKLKTYMDNSFITLIKPLGEKLELSISNEELDSNLSNIKVLYKEKEELKVKLKERKILFDKLKLQENNNIKLKKSIEDRNEVLRKEININNVDLLNSEGNLKTKEAEFRNIITEFKGNIKSLKELEEEEEILNKNLFEIKEDYKLAEEAFNKGKSKYDREKGNLEALLLRKEILEQEYKEAVENFRLKVIELGLLDYKTYIEAKMDEKQMKVLEDEINNYNISLSKAEGLYLTSVKECENINIKETQTLTEIAKDKKGVLLEEEKKEKELFSNINQNEKIIANISNYSELIEKDEKEYMIKGRLSKIVNGENPRKVSFERYVLATYFDDIIETANKRFSAMTNNRYELVRKEQVGDKRKGQGLDLDILDYYTAKKRDVRTLSGGESFKASLAMALGLADVIQEYAGGVQLDTVFIDEGFGTLDPESLEKAIECLVELRNDGRVVGIISHVEELKDRIDAKIIVESVKGVSTIKVKV
ncbi:SMC family ATPase [Clostridium sp.]|uniref:AAA family ATPase n=1 Tax=Clostridium sp. TaxID=1506 RepID=UPI0026022DAC|nr:SMC family ATPase [Clostridium sp.]